MPPDWEEALGPPGPEPESQCPPTDDEVYLRQWSLDPRCRGELIAMEAHFHAGRPTCGSGSPRLAPPRRGHTAAITRSDAGRHFPRDQCWLASS
jgi:hypothetical protein